ncbi:MAG: hypothetical protein GF350_08935 [Chitinivibrionales bacterium]|nr:hypothetical protein [Chitinivibrionales bacterium]
MTDHKLSDEMRLVADIANAGGKLVAGLRSWVDRVADLEDNLDLICGERDLLLKEARQRSVVEDAPAGDDSRVIGYRAPYAGPPPICRETQEALQAGADASVHDQHQSTPPKQWSVLTTNGTEICALRNTDGIVWTVYQDGDITCSEESHLPIPVARYLLAVFDKWQAEQAEGLTHPVAAKPTECMANRDGECTHPGCPQVRDGEPKRSGRSCPRGDG